MSRSGSPRAHLGDYPEQVGEADRNADKASDLTDSVPLAVDKRQARRCSRIKCNADGRTLNVLDGTEIR